MVPKGAIDGKRRRVVRLYRFVRGYDGRHIVSVLGVYSGYYDNFPVGQFFGKGIVLKGGQAPAHKYIDELLQYAGS
jgi:hypothetical protein